MNVKTLATGVTSVSTQDAVNFTRELGRVQSGIAQVDGMSGTETVLVQGRLDGGFDWVTVATFTADGAKSVMIFPEMRSNVTVRAAGTISVRIGA